MKTLLFCTSYFASQSAWDQRYQRWLDFHKATRLDADAIVLIDDGSPFLPPGVATIAAADIGKKPLPREAIVHFASNLGRTALLEYPGWIRSFIFSLHIAEAYGFDKIVHIESDSYLLSDPMVSYINRQTSGWTAFWVPFYSFAETAIQILNRDQYPRLAQFRGHGPYVFRDVLMEEVLPITLVEKKFLGDRYPEMRQSIPKNADYVVNTRVDTILPRRPRPPAQPGLFRRLFHKPVTRPSSFEPLPRVEADAAVLGRIDALLAHSELTKALVEIAALDATLARDPQVLLRAGIAHYTAGNVIEARKALESAVSLAPDLADGQKFLAATRMQQDETGGAISAAMDAVRLKRDDAGLLNMAGAFMLQGGKHADAIDYLERAFALNPLDLSPLANLASVQWQDEAVVARYPDGSESVNARSRELLMGLARDGRLTRSALLALMRLGVRHADDFRVLIPAVASLDLDELDDAETSFGVANFLSSVGDANSAYPAYLNAERLKPDDARYQNGVAYLGLSLEPERFTQHFVTLARTWPKFNPPAYSDDTEAWHGQDLAGEPLFVYQEQGVGDALMALRLISAVEARGIAVVLWTQPGIADLARASFSGRYIDQPERPNQSTHGCKYAIALLGLIPALGLDHDTVLALYRAVVPQPARVARLLDRCMFTVGSLRVGLALLGNPGRKDDELRSVPPTQWQALSTLSGIDWVNLNVDARDELDQLKRDFQPLATSEGGSFDDTAAMIAALDVVVAIDSVVAHLAALQGKPVLLLAPTICDWRWQIGADLTPWWPSVEVWRADAPQSFAAALTQVSKRLRTMSIDKANGSGALPPRL